MLENKKFYYLKTKFRDKPLTRTRTIELLFWREPAVTINHMKTLFGVHAQVSFVSFIKIIISAYRPLVLLGYYYGITRDSYCSRPLETN